MSVESPQVHQNRTKALVLAVVLSLLTLYTNTTTDHYEGPAFEYNITNPLPQGSYALCSAEGVARGVYTVDATDGVVECVLVVDEWVKGTGYLGEVKEAWKGIGASDLLPVVRVPQGAVVVPGFADSHCHILEYGFSKQIPLGGLRTIKESVEAVAHYVQSNPDILADEGGIVEGWGWDHKTFEGGKMPTASDLSSHPVLANRQIILLSKDTQLGSRRLRWIRMGLTRLTWMGVLSCGMCREMLQAYSLTRR
ncbi:hypothetical protein FA15DRAFT_675417 [Coprinopsis marcescibilis]|uniref:Amidohydrolase 3 domain-containing protein n=1 Tax=Coprinopsis marcescibilis TaxID=230819 RepID=A0A5C3KEU4_COPMA|nr:hypothetical protein FA15DRAFT_675417 [Coprinopsis marcescibilis]